MKNNYITCFLFSSIFYSLNIFADISGNPGEIIPLKASNSDKENNLTIQIEGSLYKLIPLPYEKQDSSINIDGQSIFIKKKDFGESRITIKNDSMVNLNKKDSERAYKESQIIREALNVYSKSLEPNLDFISPVNGIISSKYGKKRAVWWDVTSAIQMDLLYVYGAGRDSVVFRAGLVDLFFTYLSLYLT